MVGLARQGLPTTLKASWYYRAAEEDSFLHSSEGFVTLANQPKQCHYYLAGWLETAVHQCH